MSDVVCEVIAQLPTKYGTFEAHGYVDQRSGEHHVALVKGDIADGEPVLCRVHSECLTGDTFGSLRCDCGEQRLIHYLTMKMRSEESRSKHSILQENVKNM